MSYFPKPEKNENDLAIILREDTATRSVQAGQYVSWRGRTGKAKADIQQGDALSVGLFDYDEDGALNSMLGVPDYSNTTDILSQSQSTDGFTCPQNGYLYVYLRTDTNRGAIHKFTINGLMFCPIDTWGSVCQYTDMIPVGKDDVVKLTSNSGWTTTNFYFIPSK